MTSTNTHPLAESNHSLIHNLSLNELKNNTKIPNLVWWDQIEMNHPSKHRTWHVLTRINSSMMDELMYIDATKLTPLTQVKLSEYLPIVGWGFTLRATYLPIDSAVILSDSRTFLMSNHFGVPNPVAFQVPKRLGEGPSHSIMTPYH